MTSIWGIARTTIAEGIRMKVAVVFILLLVVIVPTLPMAASGDGTLKGRVQSFLNYSLFATWVLLGLLTVFMSCSTLASEIKNRQIYSLASKPVARWKVLLGKWLGVTVLNVGLLAGVAAGIAAGARYLHAQPGINRDDELAVKHEILTARVPLRPQPPDFSGLVEARYKELEQAGQLPRTVFLGGRQAEATRENVLQQMGEEYLQRWRNIRPFEQREYLFENVRVDRERGKMLFLRFKIQARPIPVEQLYKPLFALGDPKYGVSVVDIPAVAVGRFHTFPVPADLISPKGTLKVTFLNDPLAQPEVTQTMVYFDGADGLEILYRVGGFHGNLVRALAMILVSLMFFAALGLMASTFLSFPVAVLMVLLIFAVGMMTSFLLEALEYQGWQPGSDEIVGPLGYVLHPLSYAFVRAVPSLATYNPIDTFADGRNVSLMWIWLSLRDLILIRGTLVALLGVWFFHRRELAEVIV